MMKTLPLSLALLGTAAVAACAPVAPPPLPLVVYPGANKTPEAFQQDETACRQQAGTAASVPAAQVTAPLTAPVTTPAGTAAQPTTAPLRAEPADVYLQCMASRGNQIGPAPTVATARYSVYYPAPFPAPFPAYGPYGAGLWDDPFWFGYYGSPGYLWGGGGYGWGGGYRGGFYRGGFYRGGYFRGGYHHGYGGFHGPFGGPGHFGGPGRFGGPGGGFRGRH